jgi:hypothetical protein
MTHRAEIEGARSMAWTRRTASVAERNDERLGAVGVVGWRQTMSATLIGRPSASDLVAAIATRIAW